MIQKEVKIRKINEVNENDDLEFWLGKSPSERIEAVEFLRRQYHGNQSRLQRSVTIIQRP